MGRLCFPSRRCREEVRPDDFRNRRRSCRTWIGAEQVPPWTVTDAPPLTEKVAVLVAS